MVAFLTSEGFLCSMVVDKGQPLTLSIWDALLKFLGDVDTALPSLLMQGVPTGILTDIPVSGVWRPVEPDDRPNLELLLHSEPWGSALDDPECLMEVVEADVQAGFAEWIPGGLPEAKARYGDLCAAGRLGLVKKDGSQPRLIGDSSISNANQLSRICESRVTLSCRCSTVCISSPGYCVACLLVGYCQSPQKHSRLPRRKRFVSIRSCRWVWCNTVAGLQKQHHPFWLRLGCLLVVKNSSSVCQSIALLPAG